MGGNHPPICVEYNLGKLSDIEIQLGIAAIVELADSEMEGET